MEVKHQFKSKDYRWQISREYSIVSGRFYNLIKVRHFEKTK